MRSFHAFGASFLLRLGRWLDVDHLSELCPEWSAGVFGALKVEVPGEFKQLPQAGFLKASGIRMAVQRNWSLIPAWSSTHV